jgi:hypothetical protein
VIYSLDAARGLVYPYYGKGFVGAKKKTSVDLLAYNSSMIKGINILKAAHAILLTSYFIGHHATSPIWYIFYYFEVYNNEDYT